MKNLAGLGLIPGVSLIGFVMLLVLRTPTETRCPPVPLQLETGIEERFCSGGALSSAQFVALPLVLVLLVIAVAFVLFSVRDAWRVLFAVDAMAVGALVLTLGAILQTNFHKHALTQVVVVLLPAAIAGFAVSAACTWVIGHRDVEEVVAVRVRA